jgi:hypothetical protein
MQGSPLFGPRTAAAAPPSRETQPAAPQTEEVSR